MTFGIGGGGGGGGVLLWNMKYREHHTLPIAPHKHATHAHSIAVTLP